MSTPVLNANILNVLQSTGVDYGKYFVQALLHRKHIFYQ